MTTAFDLNIGFDGGVPDVVPLTGLYDSPADVLRWLLIAIGQGSSPITNYTFSSNPTLSTLLQWPVYTASEPSTPDSVITTYDTTPRDNGRSMVEGEALRHHGVQIRIRGVDHPTAYRKVHALHTAVNEGIKDNVLTLPSGKIYCVYAVSNTSLLTLGKEAPNSKRSLFTINVMVALRMLN